MKIRADSQLRKQFPQLTRNQVKEAFRLGWIKESDERALKKHALIDSGVHLESTVLSKKLLHLQQGNSCLNFPILFENSNFWVIDKPPQVACNPLSLRDNNTVTAWARNKYPLINHSFRSAQPEVAPHRLDKNTSGCLIVCKSYAQFLLLRKEFSLQKVRKRYLAWCWGVPDKNKWIESSPIAHHVSNKARMVVVTSPLFKYRPPVFNALTKVTVVKQVKDRFLAEIEMSSGITHQIRVHLSNAGFPLMGDIHYDGQFQNRSDQPKQHLLRCIRIEFLGHRVDAPRRPIRRSLLEIFLSPKTTFYYKAPSLYTWTRHLMNHGFPHLVTVID